MSLCNLILLLPTEAKLEGKCLGPYGQTDPKVTDIKLRMLSVNERLFVPALLKNDTNVQLVGFISF